MSKHHWICSAQTKSGGAHFMVSGHLIRYTLIYVGRPQNTSHLRMERLDSGQRTPTSVASTSGSSICSENCKIRAPLNFPLRIHSSCNIASANQMRRVSAPPYPGIPERVLPFDLAMSTPSHYPTLSLTNNQGLLSGCFGGGIVAPPFRLGDIHPPLYAAPGWSSYRLCQVTI